MTGDDSFSTGMRAVVDDVKSSLAFLTVLPPQLVGFDPRDRPDFRRGAGAFPVAGAVIGAAGGAVLAVAVVLGLPPLAATTLAVATTMLLTGGLHEDGLADTADSFGGATAERKLEIMEDSRVGTYGAAALVFSILLRVSTLAVVVDRGALAAALALIAGEAISRAALVRLWHDLPAAKLSGLGHDAGPPNQRAMLIALVVAAAIAAVTAGLAIGLRATISGAVLAAVTTYMFTRLTARAIGGRTGDSLGACQQVALVAFLMGAAVA